MLGFTRWQIFKTSAAAVLAVGTISLLLIYFIPAPPSIELYEPRDTIAGTGQSPLGVKLRQPVCHL